MDSTVNRIKLLLRRVLRWRALRNLWRLAAWHRGRVAARPTKDVHVGCGKDSILHSAIRAQGIANLNVGKSDRVATLAEGRILVGDNGVRSIVEHPGQS